jgi:arabinosyltransferase C
VTQARATYRTARLIALVAGLLGTALAILTPFLPVKQTTAQLSWPQNGTLDSVTAPLIGYVPTEMSLSVPCGIRKSPAPASPSSASLSTRAKVRAQA